MSSEEEKRRKRDAHRFYILPGQGRGAKHRRRMIRLKAFLTGVILAAIVGAAIWLFHNREWM